MTTTTSDAPPAERRAIIEAADRLSGEVRAEQARALMAGGVAAYAASGAAQRPAGCALLALLRDGEPYPPSAAPLAM